MSVAFCTLAIHAPYRKRARLLAQDVVSTPFTIVTDEPEDFADLPHVRAVLHHPTGPMAVDYAKNTKLTGGTGAAAYHDKRFAVRAALDTADTAIFMDADSRIVGGPWKRTVWPCGLAVHSRFDALESVAEHLLKYGKERLPAFTALANMLGGSLDVALWCEESLFAVTRDAQLPAFFSAWDVAADFLRDKQVFSGEGGVVGLAAAHAGWVVDLAVLKRLAPFVIHEGGGPKT